MSIWYVHTYHVSPWDTSHGWANPDRTRLLLNGGSAHGNWSAFGDDSLANHSSSLIVEVKKSQKYPDISRRNNMWILSVVVRGSVQAFWQSLKYISLQLFTVESFVWPGQVPTFLLPRHRMSLWLWCSSASNSKQTCSVWLMWCDNCLFHSSLIDSDGHLDALIDWMGLQTHLLLFSIHPQNL